MKLKKKKNILIIGGCGYLGSVLTEFLLKKNYNIVCYDAQWFGKYNKNKKIKFIKDSIENFNKYNFKNIHTAIHLANIANDVSVEIDPSYSWKVNVLYSKIIAEKLINDGVKKIIYSSSGSVYGVKKEKKVTEDLSLKPISTYNETKMIAERVFLSYKKKIKVLCIRPATICGFSKRLRLDLSVNQLTYHAFKKRIITVHGGQQIRPNIHIKDISRAIIFLMNKNKTKHEIYNIGFENLKILEIAKKIQKKINCKIKIEKTQDIRSYRLDSTRLLREGFKPIYSIDNAIDELILFFNEKRFTESFVNHNIPVVKKILKRNSNTYKIWKNKFYK